MNECKPLPSGRPRAGGDHHGDGPVLLDAGRGFIHSSTFQLNLRALNGIGGARRDCVPRVTGVLGGVQGVFVCQTRLKLSSEVDECKPLDAGQRRGRARALRHDVQADRHAAPHHPELPRGRVLHLLTFQLNVSAFCGTRGVYGVFMAGVEGVCRHLWDV